jgi:lysophospholipase L1-like esterase
MSTQPRWNTICDSVRASIVAAVAAFATAASAAAMVAAAPAPDPLNLTLPPVCYSVVGVPLSIYYDNIVLTPEPDKFHFQVRCDLGRSAARAWTVTPGAADAGDHDWSVCVTDAAGKSVGSAHCKLHVAPADAGSHGTLRLLLVGDSLTHASVYPNEIARLLSLPGNPASKLLGTFRPAGVQPGVAHEGYGGWTWLRFASHYEPKPDGTYHKRSSPFVFLTAAGKPVLDVPRYIRTACDGAAPDAVTFLLGTNDCFAAKAEDPKSVEEKIAAMLKQADVLLAAFHQAAPQADLGVGLTVPPNSRESGFDANYHGKFHRWNWKQVQHELVRREIAHFGGRERERISVVPTELNLDPVDGFPVNNGCHPNAAGYRQIGATLYAWVKARLESPRP